MRSHSAGLGQAASVAPCISGELFGRVIFSLCCASPASMVVLVTSDKAWSSYISCPAGSLDFSLYSSWLTLTGQPYWFLYWTWFKSSLITEVQPLLQLTLQGSASLQKCTGLCGPKRCSWCNMLLPFLDCVCDLLHSQNTTCLAALAFPKQLQWELITVHCIHSH